jgi:hypothetical protein
MASRYIMQSTTQGRRLTHLLLRPLHSRLRMAMGEHKQLEGEIAHTQDGQGVYCG